jgi:glycosyltransferase involved in cell wall biosynthesis
MRFTFPILTLCKGGAQRMLVEIVNGLAHRGHQVTILMPSGGEVHFRLQAKLLKTNHPVLKESDYPPGDVIVSNYYLTVPTARLASEQGKGKHIRLSLCYEPTFLPDNHISFPTYHTTKRLIVLSKWQQQMIYLLHGIRGTIVPVGVDRIFRNMHIREAQPHLTIAAIIREPEGFAFHRDQHYLLHQLDQVKRIYPNIQIHLICPHRELVNSPALQSIRSSNRFRFFTPANDEELCYCYNQTDIFVTSSTYETANLPGLEAMKCGAALVATNAGGNEDYCRHEQNCLLSYRHESRLRANIVRLLDNSVLRKRLAVRGEEDVKKWTWERSIMKFQQAVMQYIN